MTEKRTFPGALSPEQREALIRQQAEKQRKAEEAQRIAAQKAEAQRLAENKKMQEERKRSELIERFSPKISAKASGITFGILFIVNYAIGGIDRAFSDFYTDTSYGTEMSIQTGPDLGDAIHEAYDPHFHGAYPDEYEYAEQKRFWSHKSHRSKEINGRWKKHMVLLAIEAFILACIVHSIIGTRRMVRKDVDLLLEIEKLSKEHNIHPDIVKKMMLVTPEIIKHMSKESSVYFDLLMNGDLDYEMNPQVFYVASGILEGHLQSHPEDMEKVLKVFDVESLPARIQQAAKQIKR
ncbi:MAG: hypothetical protein IKZ49_01535 [Alphaproteobacteria bacterium]|nr:hypothetical protein [Alphaproteobacteria bacterium]